MVAISIIILIVCGLLALVVLAQNPKGGGLAAGFTGAQQIGGVQRTADFLEKGTWTLAGALMVLCSGPATMDELDTPAGEAGTEQLAPTPDDGSTGIKIPSEEEGL